MIDPNAIRQFTMQNINGMMVVAKSAASSQTKTTEKLSETLESAKSKSTENTHPVAKKAAALVGGLIGITLKPFVFNEEKARQELSGKFDKFDFTDTDAKTLKAMRNDLRTIENIADKYEGSKYNDAEVPIERNLSSLKSCDQVFSDNLSTKLTGAYNPSSYPNKIGSVAELANQIKALKEDTQQIESYWKAKELEDRLGRI